MKKLWFKRKWYGWGWYPSSWEGLFTTLVFIVLVMKIALRIEDSASTEEVIWGFVLPFVMLIIIFTCIAYKTGEKPKWQWGRPKDEIKDIDSEKE